MATDEDKNLFRHAMISSGVIRRDYRPGASPDRTGRTSPPAPRIPARGRRAERRQQAQSMAEQKFSDSPLPQPLTRSVDDIDDGPNTRFVRAGVDKPRWKALCRGLVPVDESIDLHGMRRHEAERALEGFLGEARRYGWRCVEIIHGKGLGSGPDGGVLRPMTLGFLKTQPTVLGFCAAPEAAGGSGATRVLLGQ